MSEATSKLSANYLPEVKEQYEDFPYPERDPQDEKLRLVSPYCDLPDRLNHYCYGGKQDFRNFRILVAGGGTGDSTIFLAEQYAPLGGTIVHLDLSTASIAIAEQRAKMRGVEKHIKFVHGSLLDADKLELGMFDYINCIGVLHHLAKPEKGLAALNNVLKHNGVMVIMVYGKYGRLSIYSMQDTFKLALKDVQSRTEKVRIGRQILNLLPSTNWYHFHSERAQKELMSDSGFFDLFLHSQDRAYTVPELYTLIETSTLKYLSFQWDTTSGRYFYNPFRLITEPRVNKNFENFTFPEQQALAELLSGNMTKHSFYTSRLQLEEPDVLQEDFVPVINYFRKSVIALIIDEAINTTLPTILCADPKTNTHTLIHIFPTTAALIFAIDNKRSIAEIIEIIIARSDFTRNQVKEHFLQLYGDLRLHDLIFLRHKSVPEFEDLETLQRNMQQRMGY